MLVTEDKRGMAYAWQESFESIAWVIGPPLGGLLAVAFGTGKALGLDSVTFLVSVAGLHRHPQALRASRRRRPTSRCGRRSAPACG